MDQKSDSSQQGWAYRLTSLEREVSQLQNQLAQYVTQRENDLQLQAIRSSVDRIENDVRTMKQETTEAKNKLIWYVFTTVIGVMAAVLIGYITHFIH